MHFQRRARDLEVEREATVADREAQAGEPVRKARVEPDRVAARHDAGVAPLHEIHRAAMAPRWIPSAGDAALDVGEIALQGLEENAP
jgi:hypothetical protein